MIPQVRRAAPGDAAALTVIYNHYIRDTPATFDIAEKSVAETTAWLNQFSDTGRYQCFVAQDAGRVIGWASSHPYGERAAYAPTIRVSIYLAPGATGQGAGRRLYQALFAALEDQDIHRAYAGIVLPNAASVALHRAFGFEPVGIYGEVGRKFGRYWDVAAYLRPMGGRL